MKVLLPYIIIVTRKAKLAECAGRVKSDAKGSISRGSLGFSGLIRGSYVPEPRDATEEKLYGLRILYAFLT
jgi:hypothetical protein